jgi:hypothetical protein
MEFTPALSSPFGQTFSVIIQEILRTNLSERLKLAEGTSEVRQKGDVHPYEALCITNLACVYRM